MWAHVSGPAPAFPAWPVGLERAALEANSGHRDTCRHGSPERLGEGSHPEGCGSQQDVPEGAQVFWTHFGWNLTIVRGSHWFSSRYLLLFCLESPNLSPTSPTASDHPERMREEVERTGRTDSTPGSASTDLGQVTKLCSSVFLCHRWREDCQTQCPVRTRELWREEQAEASDSHMLPAVSGGWDLHSHPELSLSSAPFYTCTPLLPHKSCPPMRVHRATRTHHFCIHCGQCQGENKRIHITSWSVLSPSPLPTTQHHKKHSCVNDNTTMILEKRFIYL